MSLNVAPAADAATLAEVRVRYKPADGDTSTERSYSIALSETRGSVDATTPAFRFGAAVAELAEILRGSEHSEGARFDDVIALAQSAGYESATRASSSRSQRGRGISRDADRGDHPVRHRRSRRRVSRR